MFNQKRSRTEKPRHKKDRQGGRRGVYLFKGAILGLAVFAVLLAVTAIIVTNTDINSDKYSLFLKIIIPVSSFFASIYAGLKSKLKGITAGLLQTAVFIIPVTVILLAANRFSLQIADFLFIPVSFAAGAVAGIISANIKR